MFKVRQESPKQKQAGLELIEICLPLPPQKYEGMTSAPMQDNADQIYTEELCYILVDHKALRGRPSDSSAEGFYENVSSKAERHRESSRGVETEYSVLRFPSTPQPPPPTDGEYELLVPSRLSFHARQQPRPLTASFETHFSHLQ